MLSAIFFVPASAQETQAGQTAGITVISLGAEQMQAEGAAAIQNALLTAKKNASDANIYKIVVAPGTYSIESSLKIPWKEAFLTAML